MGYFPSIGLAFEGYYQQSMVANTSSESSLAPAAPPPQCSAVDNFHLPEMEEGLTCGAETSEVSSECGTFSDMDPTLSYNSPPTTGGTPIHTVVPRSPRWEWDALAAATEQLCEQLMNDAVVV